MSRTGRCCPMFLGLWLVAGPAPATDIYKWTDEAGRVHYSDSPDSTDALQLEIKSEPPQADPGLPQRRQTRQKLLEQFSDERRTAATKAEQQARQQAAQDQKCDAARKLLRQYTHSGYLYEENEQGERRILNDAERAAEEARLRTAINKNCRQL